MNHLNFKHRYHTFRLIYSVMLLALLLPALRALASENINGQNNLTLPPPMPVPYYRNLADGEYDKVVARARNNFVMATCQHWSMKSAAYDAQLLQVL